MPPADNRPLLTFRDWEELLALEDLTDSLRLGHQYPQTARNQIEEGQQDYPDVPFDYIRVLDGFMEFLISIEAAIEEQNAALESLSRSLMRIGYTLSWDTERLLTVTEKEDIQRLVINLDDMAARNLAEAEHYAALEEAYHDELEWLLEEESAIWSYIDEGGDYEPGVPFDEDDNFDDTDNDWM